MMQTAAENSIGSQLSVLGVSMMHPVKKVLFQDPVRREHDSSSGKSVGMIGRGRVRQDAKRDADHPIRRPLRCCQPTAVTGRGRSPIGRAYFFWSSIGQSSTMISPLGSASA